MVKLTNNKNRIIVKFLLIILFWIIINLIFYIDDIPTDGEKKIGIPYPVVISYLDRKNMFIYETYFKFENLVYDFIYILIISLFYYFLFCKFKKK